MAHLCQGCTAVRRCSPCDDSAETPSLRNFWSQPPLETPPSPASRQNTRTDCLLSVEMWSSPSGLPSNRTLLREYDRFLYQYFSRYFHRRRRRRRRRRHFLNYRLKMSFFFFLISFVAVSQYFCIVMLIVGMSCRRRFVFLSRCSRSFVA